VLSNSPYDNYDLGQTYYNHNFLASLIHAFSPNWTSQSKVVFNRLTNLSAGPDKPRRCPDDVCQLHWRGHYSNDLIAFPGYNPFTPAMVVRSADLRTSFNSIEDLKLDTRQAFAAVRRHVRLFQDNRTYAATRRPSMASQPAAESEAR